jgi:hypothetical protein
MMPHPGQTMCSVPQDADMCIVGLATISAATPSGQDGFIVHFDIALREYAACCIDDSHPASC